MWTQLKSKIDGKASGSGKKAMYCVFAISVVLSGLIS